MDVEEDTLSLIEKISEDRSCFCVNVRCGTKLIAILGILFGFTCAVMLLLRDRKYLTATTLILVVFLSIFIIINVLFVLTSVMLLMAALDENPDLMSYYIWLSIVYLCVQLVLAIAIPLVLIAEGRYPVAIALIWMVIIMVVGLGWTHFISVVSSYRMSLLSIDELWAKITTIRQESIMADHVGDGKTSFINKILNGPHWLQDEMTGNHGEEAFRPVVG